MPDEPISTIFAPLDGGPPSEFAENASDVTVPGPELGKEDADEYIVPGPQPPVPEAADQTLPTDRPEALEPKTQQLPAKKRTASERIRALVGERNEAREENTLLQQQVALMSQQLQQTQQLIAQLAANRPQPQVPAAPGGEQFYGEAPQPQAAPGLDINSTVHQAVAKALEPVLSAARQRTQFDELRSAHEASFAAAAEDYPELRDPNSVFRQTWNQLYADSPLLQHPRAPEYIALQARGLLADEQATTRATSVRKRQAAVTAPQTEGPSEIVSADFAAAKRAYANVMGQIRRGDSTFQTYRKARMLQQYLNQKV